MPEKILTGLFVFPGASGSVALGDGGSSALRRRRAHGQMESLVSRMESVAQRISARDTSASQRSVLVSRFNDLTRRVNLLDGIVGGEGQEVRGRRALRLGNGRQADPGSARVESRRRLVGARPPGRVDRPDRHFVQAREVGPVRETPITAQAVRELRQGIERQGLAVIGERRSTGALLDFLA